MMGKRKLLVALASATLVVAGCGQLLSLDDLRVKETEGVAGTGGSTSGAAGSTAAGTAGTAAGTGGTTGGTAGKAGTAGSAGVAGGGAGGGATTSAKPPERPPGDPTPSGKGKSIAFAARKYALGVTDPTTGAPDTKAWRKFGFDFDDKCTTAEQSKSDDTGVCKKANPNQNVEDGEDCRDNNFGSGIVNLISLANPKFESDLNDNVEGGSSTLLLVIDDLDDGKDDPYAPGRLYAIGTKKTGVTWDDKDVRKVNADSVANNDINKPKVKFSKGYVKDNVWVSGDYKNTPGVISFPISSDPVDLVATTLAFVIPLNDMHDQQVQVGSFGAVLPIDPFLQVINPSLKKTANCGDVSFYLQVIGQTVDIFDSPPSYTGAALTCNALSFGAGVLWGRVAIPTAGDVVVFPKDPPPCDGGL